MFSGKSLKMLGFGLLSLATVFAGCSKEEQEIPQEEKTESAKMMSGPSEIRIPDDVKAKWTAIKVEVLDNEAGSKQEIEIAIGEEKLVEGAGLKIRAVSFLPAFHMDGPVVTSRSNEPENPAAQIEISEGESQVFKGWLFTLYPTTHAFTHPKYSITLLGGVAGGKS